MSSAFFNDSKFSILVMYFLGGFGGAINFPSGVTLTSPVQKQQMHFNGFGGSGGGGTRVESLLFSSIILLILNDKLRFTSFSAALLVLLLPLLFNDFNSNGGFPSEILNSF